MSALSFPASIFFFLDQSVSQEVLSPAFCPSSWSWDLSYDQSAASLHLIQLFGYLRLWGLVLDSWLFHSGINICAPKIFYGILFFLFNRSLQRRSEPGNCSLRSFAWLPFSTSHQNIMRYFYTYLTLVFFTCLRLLISPSVPSWHQHCLENWRDSLTNAHLTIGFSMFLVIFYQHEICSGS